MTLRNLHFYSKQYFVKIMCVFIKYVLNSISMVRIWLMPKNIGRVSKTKKNPAYMDFSLLKRQIVEQKQREM